MSNPFNRRIEQFGRAFLLSAAVLLAISVFFIGAGLFAKWAAAAILLVALPLLFEEIAPRIQDLLQRANPELKERFVHYFPFAAVGIVTLIALYPVSLFQMPISQDHVNHYFATHILVHEMIPSGRIFGWTDRIGTGYPFGDIYHTIPYFLTGFLHLISFGLIPLGASYAFGITVAWLVTAFAATAWARRIAGPFGATLAGIFTALDAGGDREGGWGYAMFHGVWPQHLSTGVFFFALLALVRLCEKPDTGRLAGAALLVGVSLWLHPMTAVTVLIAGFLLIAVRLFGPRSDASASETVLPLIAALIAAGFIGLVWMIRMMVNGDVVYAFPSEWEPLSTLMRKLLDGEMFAHQPVLISPLALAGIVALSLRKKRFDLYTVLLLFGLVLAGSMDLIIASDAGLFGRGIGLIQYRRFSIPAKPLFYAAAGAGLSVIARGVADYVRARQRPLETVKNGLAARVLFAIVAAPFIYSLGHASTGIIKSPVAQPLTLAATGDAEGLAEVRRVLKEEQSRCKTRPCTAVYWEKPGHGGLYPVLSFADLDYRWIPMLKLPANNFDYQGVASNVETMAELGATVAVSKWKQTDSGLKALGKFGKHYVYRILLPKDGRAELSGSGTLHIAQWSPERRVIDISGTQSGGSTLTLLFAPYDKWHASLNGKPLSLVNRRQGSLYVTVVPDVSDGKLVLTYKDTFTENLFFFVGIAVFLSACVFSVRRPQPLPALLFLRPEPWAGKIIAPGLIAAAVLGGAALLVLGRNAAERYWLKGEKHGAALESILHEREPSSLVFKPSNICVRAYTRDPKFGCSEHDDEPELIPAKRKGSAMPSCLSIGIPEQGRTDIAFDLPSRATKVKGMLHLLGGAALNATLITQSDERRIEDITKSTAFEINAPGSGQLTISLFGDASKACIEAVAISASPIM